MLQMRIMQFLPCQLEQIDTVRLQQEGESCPRRAQLVKDLVVLSLRNTNSSSSLKIE